VRVVETKLRDNEAEAFFEACRRFGKSQYEVLRELILRWLREQGSDLGSSVASTAEVGHASELASLKEVVDQLASGFHHLAERVAELERRLSAQNTGSSGESLTPAEGASQGGAKPRRTAVDILREQRFILEPDVPHLRNRDAFFGKLRSGGAVVIETAKGRVAVLPEVWEDFRSRLSRVGTSREDAVKGTLGGELFKLFKFLREAGEVYYDSTASSWRFVEEAGEE